MKFFLTLIGILGNILLKLEFKLYDLFLDIFF